MKDFRSSDVTLTARPTCEGTAIEIYSEGEWFFTLSLRDAMSLSTSLTNAITAALYREMKGHE